MAETDASRVADYFISFSREHGDPISNLKLQKLLYYAQAWFLAIHGRPLFDERIEAWVHGPAVPPVYGRFKDWTWQPIAAEVSPPADLPPEIVAHLKEVMDTYGVLSAYELERMTHSEDPWKDARLGLPPDEASTVAIPAEAMARFYHSRLNGKN
jgi:uncharacterized phage-associated protein